MMLFAVLVADVESSQPDGGTAHVKGGDGPNEAHDGQIPVGAFDVEKAQGDKRGGESEADDVGHAVELSAEVGGVAGEPRKPAIQGVEDHGQKD